MGQKSALLIIRLLTLITLVVMLMVQVKSIRVFRFELTVSEGLIVTYIIAHLGLALCAGSENCGAFILQIYLLIFGVLLFGINTFTLFLKWINIDELTYAVIELLMAMNLNVRAQMIVKISLNVFLLLLLLVDLIMTPVVMKDSKRHYHFDFLKGF